MIIGFWISLFVLIISITVLFLYLALNIGQYGYSESLYYIFGMLIAISLFFMIFCGYYAKIF